MTTQTTIPKGWKLVPIEPTKAMTDRGIKAMNLFRYDWVSELFANCVYAVMVAAAPEYKE